MVDWSKYPVIRARVSPALRDDVHAAADRAGLSVPDWTRWALHSASTNPTNDDDENRRWINNVI